MPFTPIQSPYDASPSMVDGRLVGHSVHGDQLGIDPLVTQLVVGQPQSRQMPGELVFRKVRATSIHFRYEKYGVEHLQHIETERGFRAPFNHVDWKADTVPDRLKRFGLRVLKDRDELSNAHPRLAIRRRSSILSKRHVDLDVEIRRRNLLVDPANYLPSQVLTLGAGAEWNSPGGDSRSDIRYLVTQITSRTPLQAEDLSVFLTKSSLEAAQDDPILLGKRGNFSTKTPSVADLKEYWDVGEVVTGNAVMADGAGNVIPLYPDMACVFYRGNSSEYDTTYGDLEFAVEFKWNKGVAERPWYDQSHTSWSYPWEDWSTPAFITSQAGGVIYGTNKDS